MRHPLHELVPRYCWFPPRSRDHLHHVWSPAGLPCVSHPASLLAAPIAASLLATPIAASRCHPPHCSLPCHVLILASSLFLFVPAFLPRHRP